MGRIYSVLTVTFLICMFSGAALAQCIGGGVPPYTTTRTISSVGKGTNVDIDFVLNRYHDEGINDFLFYSDGYLKYKGNNFQPAVLAASSVTSFQIYTHRDYTVKKPNGLFSEGLAIALPKSNASNAITTFYVLDIDNCSSRKIAMRPLNLDKVIWGPRHEGAAILCEAEGERFALVNVKTGKVVLRNATQVDHPCGELAGFAYQPITSLGLYDRPINDLFPEKVGSFHLANVPRTAGSDPMLRDLKVTEMSSAVYESSSGSSMKIAAIKFASPADTKEGLKYLREHRRFSPRLERENSNVGIKKSGRKIIGERIESEIIDQNGTPRGAGVLWTNGSVLFVLEGSEKLAVLLAFERHFPY